jgi:hypothetical protein
MINEPIKHDTNYPPSASAGGNNAYYLKGCDAVQRSPSYAACLFKIGEIEAGRENVLHNDCAAACRQGKCLAREMRDQEQLAGAALYYFPRTPPQALHLPFKVAGDFGVRITNLTDPALIPRDPKKGDRFAAKPFPKVKPVDPLDAELEAMSGGYADAITAAVAELPPAAPAPAPKSPPIIVQPAPVAAPPKPMPAVTSVGRPPMQAGETPLQYARRIAASRTPA